MVRKIFRCIVAIFFVVIFGISVTYADNYGPRSPSSIKSTKQKKAKTIENKTYYTNANIWVEFPRDILSTNFHKGTMIPAGTKVEITYCRRGKIKFMSENEDVAYTFVHARKHSRIKLQEVFGRYFSENNVMAGDGSFHKLTGEEQENVKNGIIDVGMSKDAVLMAYGYPPSHVTPNLSGNVWTYWENRVRRVVVHFKDNNVFEIKK